MARSLKAADPRAAETAGPEPIEPLLGYFAYTHLREDLHPVCHAFAELARDIAAILPKNPERTSCLRKLVKAKDAGVRAVLAGE